jgi:hypothetical protein
MKKLTTIIATITLICMSSISSANGVTTNKEWQQEARQIDRMNRQFVGIGAGALISGIGGTIRPTPVISTNFAFLWIDYYVKSGASFYLGGRVRRNRTHTEVIPFAVGATLWYGNPVWARNLDRLYDISIKTGLTVRFLRFAEISIFAHINLPDPSVLINKAEDTVESIIYNEEQEVSIKNELLDAVIPSISITIRGVSDLKIGNWKE